MYILFHVSTAATLIPQGFLHVTKKAGDCEFPRGGPYCGQPRGGGLLHNSHSRVPCAMWEYEGFLERGSVTLPPHLLGTRWHPWRMFPWKKRHINKLILYIRHYSDNKGLLITRLKGVKQNFMTRWNVLPFLAVNPIFLSLFFSPSVISTDICNFRQVGMSKCSNVSWRHKIL